MFILITYFLLGITNSSIKYNSIFSVVKCSMLKGDSNNSEHFYTCE